MLDDRDWSVIEALQEGIAAEPRPYDRLAEAADMSVAEFLRHAQRLKDEGVIRRMGVRVRHHKAGIGGNVMSVWRVPEDDAERVGRLFSAMPEVSHCYTRMTYPDFPYTLYAMLHARTEPQTEAIIERMSQESGIADCVKLRTVRELKKSTPRYTRPSE